MVERADSLVSRAYRLDGLLGLGHTHRQVVFWLEGAEGQWFGGLPVEVEEGGDGGVSLFQRFMFGRDGLVVLVVGLI